MTEVTTNGIVKWTNRDPASIVQESQAQGDSIELALSKRERYDFVWANSAERTAQTGMVQGSRGYQVDTKSEYLFDNSAWRLAIPYAEYTHSASIAAGGVPKPIGTLTINNTNTTSTLFTSTSPTPATGQVILVDPGVYFISLTSGTNPTAAVASRTFFELSSDSDTANSGAIINRTSIPVGEDRGTLMQVFRTTASNQSYFLRIYEASNTHTWAGVVRVGRLG